MQDHKFLRRLTLQALIFGSSSRKGVQSRRSRCSNLGFAIKEGCYRNLKADHPRLVLLLGVVGFVVVLHAILIVLDHGWHINRTLARANKARDGESAPRNHRGRREYSRKEVVASPDLQSVAGCGWPICIGLCIAHSSRLGGARPNQATRLFDL